jgi:site-specific DNA recombinase
VKQYFGYIRVSTVKQGQQGVSLQEQRDAILRYASRNSLEIVSWFEEQESAAKRGRPVFNRMLKLLRLNKVSGVVLHKIDRGARNLKDWADIGELSDAGIEIHFANEALDLHSRGGRLSADIQAVIAADYIRNLREETLKGFYGRLKQGIYPLGAPIGYVDRGGGKVKEPDEIKAPLVRKAFELYASCRFSVDSLGEELHRLGLRNKRGGKITRGGLAKLLKNPFYIGLIRLRSSGETFPGAHSPLIAKSLFDRVQLVLCGKTIRALQKHDLIFRRLVQCAQCGYMLIGEIQKGYHYYRCHSAGCKAISIREEVITQAMETQLSRLRYNEDEVAYFHAKVVELRADWEHRMEKELASLKLVSAQLKDRLNRLTDAFIDGGIDRVVFEQRKTALLVEQKSIEENLANLRDGDQRSPAHLREFLELAGNALLSYRMGLPEEKRNLLKTVTSNREASGKNVAVKLSLPFFEVANKVDVSSGGLDRSIPRTWDPLLEKLAQLNVQGKLPVLPGSAGSANSDNNRLP